MKQRQRPGKRQIRIRHPDERQARRRLSLLHQDGARGAALELSGVAPVRQEAQVLRPSVPEPAHPREQPRAVSLHGAAKRLSERGDGEGSSQRRHPGQFPVEES